MAVATARLSRLTYRYPGSAEAALDHVTLALDGGVSVVVGPSGGGKSTLLRALNGLVPHFHGGRISGVAEVGGLDIFATPTRTLARVVGFVFQDPELQTIYATVEHEVAFGLENIGFPPHAMRSRVEQALFEAGVEHLVSRHVRTLSGGERQRVAIASALVTQPALVVLDEPTSQLDTDGARQVLAAVKNVAESGRAVVIAEHRVEPLIHAASAVVEVERGTVRCLDPRHWTPPAVDQPVHRGTGSGGEAWSLSNVTAGFGGAVVLDAVNLGGSKGEVVALAGPNGGGKTMLLRLIAGSLAPLAGTVVRRPGRIAYLPQNPGALLHRPSVRSEVELTLTRAGGHSSPDEILQALHLTGVADRYPRDLSSGERQRAAIAAVLAGEPQLVLLDEPTRGMDTAARASLIGLVTDLRDAGASIVVATHDEALRDSVADRVAYVADGVVREAKAVAR